MLTNEEIEVLLRFLNRVDLKGSEALTFLTVTTKLSNSAKTIPDDPKE